jgi:hypothetical protein
MSCQVDVLWVINQQHTKWEESLPQDTKDMLAASRRIEGIVGAGVGQFAGDILELPGK